MHVQCFLCGRSYGKLWGPEDREGNYCAVIVTRDHLYGTYGSTAFDNDYLEFVNGVRPPEFEEKALVCDFCVLNAVENGIVRVAESPPCDHATEVASAFYRRQIVLDFQRYILSRHGVYPFRSLVISLLWEGGKHFLFELNDGLLFAYHDGEVKCVDANHMDAHCPNETLKLLKDYPFWERYLALRM